MTSATNLLAGLPAELRTELLDTYGKIASNYAEHRWEPSELNGGKFCEIVYSIVNGALRGNFPTKASKPPAMLQACQALESMPAVATRVGDRSLRILIPRVLPVLYEIRNNRNVGHVGAEVDPNFLDATAVYSLASWTLAELIRIFHNIPIKEAQAIVDALIERKIPLIWEVGDKRRVLDHKLKAGEQILLLLHSRLGSIQVSDLISWIEYSNPSKFRNDILDKLHKNRMIEFDRKANSVRISPKGVTEVEAKILKTRAA